VARLSISRTFNPIHFEDLDPHRFEDLIRELAYDFRDWQSIEATGRSGSDDGFDIRAYERARELSIESDDSDSEDSLPHPMEGNVWMIQCKREKQIGPKKITSIISDGVNPDSPPYGYVLAAPANFSKASYDKFRDELRNRGVMEFYLWGRAALEDMLHLPKNDHILFTFFGVSLVSKRKSRATEIRSVISTKNKLMKLFGEHSGHRPLLLRDTNDTHYPYKEEYKDFAKHPRWKEFPFVEMHPLGLIVQVAKHYAFFDSIKKEWDHTDAVNLVSRQEDEEDDRAKKHDLQQRIEGFWEFFQKANQATYIINGLIPFDAIVVIDSEGDRLYKFPHIYADFQGKHGPFMGTHHYLEFNERQYESVKDLKRVKKFPSSFSKPKIGTVYRDKVIQTSEQLSSQLKHGNRWIEPLYSCDGSYDFLEPGDVIGVDKTQDSSGNLTLIKITNKRTESGRNFLKKNQSYPMPGNPVEAQIGRKLKSTDKLMIIEFKIVHEWQIESN